MSVTRLENWQPQRTIAWTLAAALVFLAVSMLPDRARAAPCGSLFCQLVDGNSTLDVDHLYSDGIYEWEVDGVEQISGPNWFWVRVGSAGSGANSREIRLDDEVANYTSSGYRLASSDLSGNVLALSYTGHDLSIDLSIVLDGGATGSGSASINKTLTITNNSGAGLDVVAFEFADFDVNFSNSNETAELVQTGRIEQTDVSSGASLSFESSITPTHFEIGPDFIPGGGTILQRLNDATATTLGDSGNPFGPGDAEFAFQYDFLGPLGAGASASFATTITLVPEPGPFACAAAVLLALGSLSRCRHRS